MNWAWLAHTRQALTSHSAKWQQTQRPEQSQSNTLLIPNIEWLLKYMCLLLINSFMLHHAPPLITFLAASRAMGWAAPGVEEHHLVDILVPSKPRRVSSKGLVAQHQTTPAQRVASKIFKIETPIFILDSSNTHTWHIIGMWLQSIHVYQNHPAWK